MLKRAPASLHRDDREARTSWFKTIALADIIGTLGALVAIASVSLFGRRTIESHLVEDGTTAAAVAVFLGTYAVVAIGKLPGFH
jgi:hypothetical protein